MEDLSMLIIDKQEDDMRFFRKKPKCKNICSHYKTEKSVSSEGVVNQFKCITCNVYLFPSGLTGSSRFRVCKCCGSPVKYIEILSDDPDQVDQELEETKKSSPIILEKKSNRKTYGELLEFINEGMHLQANYQLVMLKYLVNHKIADKAEISEDLAYHNNKNVSNIDEVKKFFDVPVYGVLENKGFTTKTDRYGKYDYYLNVDLDEFQTSSVNELLERKIKEYNLEHYIPENEFDSFGLNVEQKNNLLKIIEKEYAGPKSWIWSVTQENWEILKAKNVWGSRIPKERIRNKIKSGDKVAFYVIRTGAFKGIFEFIGDWFDSPGETWADDILPYGKLRYISQIKIRPICLGNVLVPSLYEKLELFKGKPQNIRNLILQGGSGYPSNNSRSLLEDDFATIIDELKNNSENDLDFSKTRVQPYENIEKSLEESEPETPKNLDEQSKIFVDNTPDGLMIKEFKEIKSEILRKGQIVSNDQLMEKFGVGNMGGIRYSRRNNILVLCSTLSDDYEDTFDETSGLIKYSGEGQIGEQNLTGGNYKIANAKNIPMLYFKEKPQEPGARKRGALDNIYIFVGKVKYLKHYFTNEPDKLGNQRQLIKFILEVE